MFKITRFILSDILRNKIVVFYTLILAVLSWSVFFLEDNTTKGLLTLLNVILFTVPLVSVIFSTIYIYNSAEFIELLLSQPLRRAQIWRSLFLGLCICFIVAFMLGSGIPLLIYSPDRTGTIMILAGMLISVVFVSLSFLSAVYSRDKARGIGKSILLWLFFALLFDGMVLFLLFQLEEYPIEKPMLGVTALNPIGLARIIILLQMDVSAMLGYTGAIFKDFFGAGYGLAIAFLVLLLWIAVPFRLSLIRFRKKDL